LLEFHEILALECFIFAFVFLVAHIYMNRRKKIVARRWWNGERYTTTVRLVDHIGRTSWRKVG
jgi:hypothetical protein